MKYVHLTLPSMKLCFAMALAAGIMAFPLPTMAEQAVQNVQQAGVVKGQVTDKNGDGVIGALFCVNYSSKRSGFLRFYLYFCGVIEER